MAEEFNPKNIERITDSARESVTIIDKMVESIKAFNKQSSSGARIGATTVKEFNKVLKLSSDINKEAAKLATTKNHAFKLSEKIAVLNKQKEDFEKRSNDMAAKAATSYGDSKTQFEQSARHLANMAREAGIVKDNYEALRIEAANLDKSTKFFTGASKFMNSIPGLKAFSGPFDKAAESAKQALIDGKSSSEAMAIGLEKFNVSIGKMILAFAVKSLFTANQQITDIGKSTESSAESAYDFRMQMSLAAASSNDLRVNSETLLKANKALNDELGLAVQYDVERLIPLAKILDAQVLTTAQAAKYNQLANNTGQTVQETLKGSEAAVNAVNNELGTRVSLKGVMEATATTSGQIKAQLGGSSEAISRAVVTAKALGFELEQVANIGKQLLNFEESIGAELEAELLTGKQLNLEKARLAALTGDYETLTKEINANVGSFSEFSNMNVLQQDAIAKAVGMTSDSLSETLLKQGDMKAMMAEAVATGDTQTIQQLEQLSNQEKFAKAVDKVKNMFVDLMAVISPITHVVGFIADMFSSIPGMIALMAMGLVRVLPLLKRAKLQSMTGAVSSIFKAAFSAGPILGTLIVGGALGALYAAVSKARSMDDGTISPEGLVVKSPKGTINLNKDDSIIAGTNLGGGGNTQPAPMTPIIVKSVTQFDSFAANNPAASDGRFRSYGNHETSFV